MGAMVLAHGLLSLGRNWADPGYWQVVFGFFAGWMVLGTLMVQVHPRLPSFLELAQASLGGAWLSLLIWGGLTVMMAVMDLWNGWNQIWQAGYWYGVGQMYLLSTGAMTLLLWAAPFKGRWDEDEPVPMHPHIGGRAKR
jgi:hypothetical protein